MRVFKFWINDLFYAYSGETKEEAMQQFFEDGMNADRPVTKTEEIPEAEWDERNITMYEDNDHSKVPFMTSIREQMIGPWPDFIFTNDTL